MKKTDLSAVLGKLSNLTEQSKRYSIVGFVAFVVILYGFIAFKINTLGNAQPSPDAVNSQVQAAQLPRIDQTVVNQLQSLQDNSVNVQALFNQARQNPFQ